jgi:hypothetical protein
VEVGTRPVVTAAGAVGVADPVGRHEASELREELSSEGMVAAEALRLGDKAEQPLRIATRECRHDPKKIRRTAYGLQSPNGRPLTVGISMVGAGSQDGGEHLCHGREEETGCDSSFW